MSAVEHFWTHGWVRVEAAFSSAEASLMRDAVWRALADAGIERDRPDTWTIERPTHLQRLKSDPVFAPIGGARLKEMLDALFDGLAYKAPTDWGAFFIAFPAAQAWSIPTAGWHIDAHYGSALGPVRGLKTHALLGDVAPHGGGTLIVSGSHRLIHDWFKAHPPPPGARSAWMRDNLKRHPYIAALHTEGDPAARIARFMERAEPWESGALQVAENTGRAGDVIVLHPLVLHVAAPNASLRPRFLLSGGVTTDQWGWQSV